MKRAYAKSWDWDSRPAIPTVYERDKQSKNLIGFERGPAPQIEIMRHAPEEELKKWKDAFLRKSNSTEIK